MASSATATAAAPTPPPPVNDPAKVLPAGLAFPNSAIGKSLYDAFGKCQHLLSTEQQQMIATVACQKMAEELIRRRGANEEKRIIQAKVQIDQDNVLQDGRRTLRLIKAKLYSNSSPDPQLSFSSLLVNGNVKSAK